MFVGSDANEEKVTAKPGNATWLVNKTENEPAQSYSQSVALS